MAAVNRGISFFIFCRVLLYGLFCATMGISRFPLENEQTRQVDNLSSPGSVGCPRCSPMASCVKF